MRLIDADALAMHMADWQLSACSEQYDTIEEAIDAVTSAPTIDAVTVVRCKDCVYRVIMRDPLRKPMDCYGCKVMHYNEDDWFCSFGEREDHE